MPLPFISSLSGSLGSFSSYAIVYFALELALVPVFFLLHRKFSPLKSPPVLALSHRQLLWKNLVAELDPLESFLPTWFTRKTGQGKVRFEDILEENALEFLAWAFHHKTLPNRPSLPHSFEELSNEELDELRGMLAEAEAIPGTTRKLKPGYNSDIRCSRLTMDPVKASFRPFAVYGVTHLLGKAHSFLLEQTLGFVSKSLGSVQYMVFHPDRLNSNEPIVFIHGIGVGLPPYDTFLRSLKQKHQDRTILILLLPHVSMRVQPYVPSRAEFVETVQSIFVREQMAAATWIAHSLGTTCFAWISKHAPELIAKALLVDPVCFTLWDGSVAHNFIYSTEFKTPGDRIVRYLSGREIFAAHALSRHFIWFENLLLASDLRTLGKPLTAFVASEDAIADSARTRQFCEKYNVGLEWMEGLGHAGWLIDKEWTAKIVEMI